MRHINFTELLICPKKNTHLACRCFTQKLKPNRYPFIVRCSSSCSTKWWSHKHNMRAYVAYFKIAYSFMTFASQSSYILVREMYWVGWYYILCVSFHNYRPVFTIVCSAHLCFWIQGRKGYTLLWVITGILFIPDTWLPTTLSATSCVWDPSYLESLSVCHASVIFPRNRWCVSNISVRQITPEEELIKP
jgi:hypothetical protein